jgi:hypothetical protein
MKTNHQYFVMIVAVRYVKRAAMFAYHVMLSVAEIAM